jgi:hypothetical protein
VWRTYKVLELSVTNQIRCAVMRSHFAEHVTYCKGERLAHAVRYERTAVLTDLHPRVRSRPRARKHVLWLQKPRDLLHQRDVTD